MENKFEKLFKNDTGKYEYGNYDEHNSSKKEIENSDWNKSFFDVVSYLKDDKEELKKFLNNIVFVERVYKKNLETDEHKDNFFLRKELVEDFKEETNKYIFKTSNSTYKISSLSINEEDFEKNYEDFKNNDFSKLELYNRYILYDANDRNDYNDKSTLLIGKVEVLKGKENFYDYDIREKEEIKKEYEKSVLETLEKLDKKNIVLEEAVENIKKESSLIVEPNLEEKFLPFLKKIIMDEVDKLEKENKKTINVENFLYKDYLDYIVVEDPNQMLEAFDYHKTKLYKEMEEKVNQKLDMSNEENYDANKYLGALFQETAFDVMLEITNKELGEKKWETGDLTKADLKEISNALSYELGMKSEYTKEEIKNDRKLEQTKEKEEKEIEY